MMLNFVPLIQRYTYRNNLFYNLRILFALAGAAALPLWLNNPTLTIPLTLGVVAAALTDLDDRLVGRLRNLLITISCFFIASASVELLFPYPWVFAFSLAFSAGGFTLLGALGQRYATIAFGALLIAIYTMQGVGIYSSWYQQPLLLVSGALWYNLLTLIGHVLFPIRPLQENMARSYELLANYLEIKANLFDPDVENEADFPWMALAMANSALISSLNQTKLSLMTRLKGDRGQHGTRRMLHYYFTAQDIHERASSSHVQYLTLSLQFRHSDILFRFQHLLMLQAQACRQLALSILMYQKYQHNPHFEAVFARIQEAINNIPLTQEKQKFAEALSNLLINLRAIDAQLINIETKQSVPSELIAENKLADDHIIGWKNIWLSLKRNFTPQSELFRHAIRMSLVLSLGYAIIQLTGMVHGYWILLTCLFVCQPNYNATHRRLILRIIGTLAGVMIGLPILYFVPSIEGQMLLIILSGVLFFAFRTVQYAHATMFITLLALLCFNLLGEGFNVAAARIYDTLLGCALAWAAVSFIWPDWKFRQLTHIVDKTLAANSRYLAAILLQYYQGKNNDLSYRIARRDAHNCDAELASVVSNMAADPNTQKANQEAAFRLLCLNHTLLSYISALGAHREQLNNATILNMLDSAVIYISNALNKPIKNTSPIPCEELSSLLTRFQLAEEPGNKERLILQQIDLILSLLPELISLRATITK